MRRIALRPVASSTLFAALLAAALPAVASDGVLEINRACVSTGCFPGDAPGYPVTITQPGSYRLTGNLSQSIILGFTFANTAIEIQAPGVDLDLGGFSISCTNPLATLPEPCPGSGYGVRSTGTGTVGVRVHNGSVRQMPEDGINLFTAGSQVKGVRTSHNGGDGIILGDGGVVTGCTAHDNEGNGIRISSGGSVQGSSATNNGEAGILSTSGGLVTGNSVHGNSGYGIDARSGSTVSNNTAYFNIDSGIRVTNGSFARGNTVNNNFGFGIEFSGISRSGFQNNFITDNDDGEISTDFNLGIDGGGNRCGTISPETCP